MSLGGENDAAHIVPAASRGPALPVPLLLLPNAKAGWGTPIHAHSSSLSPHVPTELLDWARLVLVGLGHPSVGWGP